MIELRSEENIIESWKENVSNPVVSICCITYNHEAYIEDALSGFLSQETDFPFEILIHDDASTDGTSNIIRKFEKNYPSLIKPIYQTENQYSKGYKMNPKFNFSRAKGRYIALCEGDDYWMNSNKLQMQVDVLRSDQKCQICFHPAIKETSFDKRGEFVMCKYGAQEKKISLDEVILGGGGFMPTASLLIDRDSLQRIPSWFDEQPVGDAVLQVYGALSGGALYLPTPMSVYRYNVPGSWSSSNKSIEKKLNHNQRVNILYQLLKEDLPDCRKVITKKIIRNNLLLAGVLVKRGHLKDAIGISINLLRQLIFGKAVSSTI